MDRDAVGDLWRHLVPFLLLSKLLCAALPQLEFIYVGPVFPSVNSPGMRVSKAWCSIKLLERQSASSPWPVRSGQSCTTHLRFHAKQKASWWVKSSYTPLRRLTFCKEINRMNTSSRLEEHSIPNKNGHLKPLSQAAERDSYIEE